MISKELKQAREYEESFSKYADAERPKFHACGAIGWINDPNGFSVYKDEYHLFFQYHPYSVKWGPMHWGHVKTKDFITWEPLPCAIAPDTPADDKGCFSGSAIEMPDGRQLLMYTGVYWKFSEDGQMEEHQHQCIAIGDGVDYEKYDGNPVLRSKDLPEGGSVLDFRDPHIFKKGNTYYCAVANRAADDSGVILLYKSMDALHWEFMHVLDANMNEYGKMWECPDLVTLGDKTVIMTSPQEMVPVGLEYHAGYGTIALIGTLDEETMTFKREKVQPLDYGIDFYAPQALETKDGRHVMIAWMENWTNMDSKLKNRRLFGAMTIPRELEYKNGRIIQNPVRELENYHGRKVTFDNILVNRVTRLPGVEGRWIDLTVKVRPVSKEGYAAFKLKLAIDGEHDVVLRYKPSTSTVRIDRSRCGGRFDIVHTRDFPVFPHDGEIKLRVVMDGNCCELFVNDGEQAASFKLYNRNYENKGISFEAEGTVMIDVEKYDLVETPVQA